MLVYLITNEIDGKYYVGQTIRTLSVRWHNHRSGVKLVGTKIRLYNAMRKYGVENFSIRVLAEATSREQLNYLEQLWIICLQSNNSLLGYNEHLGGAGSLGYAHTEETKKQMHKPHFTLRGRKQSPAHVEARAAKRRGLKHSSDTLLLLSAASKQQWSRKSGAERVAHCRKMAESRYGSVSNE
jgi:group I intron endonuclease